MNGREQRRCEAIRSIATVSWHNSLQQVLGQDHYETKNLKAQSEIINAFSPTAQLCTAGFQFRLLLEDLRLLLPVVSNLLLPSSFEIGCNICSRRPYYFLTFFLGPRALGLFRFERCRERNDRTAGARYHQGPHRWPRYGHSSGNHKGNSRHFPGAAQQPDY